MIKVLFLDDDVNRHKAFKQNINIPDSEIKYVYTSKDAIDAINDEKYDVVFLDHDLGGKIYVAETENTGYEVTLHIAKMPKEKRSDNVIIHSFNRSGAIRMYQSISGSVKSVHTIPFNVFLNNTIIK